MGKVITDEDKLKRTVYGVGYLGVGNYKARKDPQNMTKEYILWTNMLSRCYGKPYRNNPKNSPRYEDCTVCEEWHNFQNFAKWCNEQPNFGKFKYSLDKDLTELGNTVYCPEKCYIVAPVINAAIKVTSWKKDSHLPLGVFLHPDGKYQARVGRESKYSSCPKETAAWFLKKKKEYLTKLATEYKHEISEAIYQTLINWAPN